MKHWSKIRPIPHTEYRTYEQELSHLGITPAQASRLIKKYDDLKIQSMMFDMDISIETLSLIPKSDYQEPVWLKKWKDKIDASDSRLYDHEH